jgi:ABC-type oligopeptide transport system substrate-binding subunit
LRDSGVCARRLLLLVGAVVGLGLLGGATQTALAPEPAGAAARTATPPVFAFSSYDSVDPAVAFLTQSVNVEYATCTQLVGYPDDAAPSGWQLVPDAATSIPEPTNNGKTYTFTIRSGLTFSDGSGDVSPDSFVTEIQRLAKVPNSPGYGFAQKIEGVTEYHDGTAGSISGLQVSGNQLSITLTQADGSFLYRLAMPFFCAVPVGTPMTAQDTPIPSAGPYAITSVALTGQGGSDHVASFHLVRNAHYGGSRPATLDEIDFTRQPSLSTAYQAAQDPNPTVDFTNVAAADRDAANQAFGPGSAAAQAGHQQYFTPSANGVQYLALNTSRPGLQDVRVREAIATVINRTQLAADRQQGPPTDDLIASSVPGYHDDNVYDLLGDQSAAQALMNQAGFGAGHHLALKLITTSGAQEVTLGSHVSAALASIFVDVTYDHSLNGGAYFSLLGDPNGDWDVARASWIPDYADMNAILQPQFDGRTITVNSVGNDVSHWNDVQTNADLDYANALPAGARADAFESLALRLARDDVPMAAFAELDNFQFISSRLGCVVYQPVEFGIDLGRLCLANQVNAGQTYTQPGSVSSDTPVIASVTPPVDGDVSVIPAEQPTELTGYNVVGQQLTIEAPQAPDAAHPLSIALTLDAATLAAAGLTKDTVIVLRNGVAVQTCTGNPGEATPDPCVSDRSLDGSNNAVITILTTHASRWSFGAPDTTPPNLTALGFGVPLIEAGTTTVQVSADSDATNAEFYVGTDNGAGSNIPMSGGAGSFTTPPYGQLLSPGDYTAGARVRDAALNWSPVTTTTLHVLDRTSLDSHPANPAKGTSATFVFSSPAAGSTFECSLDGAVFSACTSPQTYTKLAKRSHRFRVRASAGGITDPTPASFAWTNGAAPKTKLDPKPPAATMGTATFTFVSGDAGATFECSLDGAPFAACSSPKTYSGLAAGPHTFAVHGIDAAGRAGKAATAKWTVDLTPPETTITRHPADPTTSTRALFKFTSSEKKGSTFACRLDGGGFGSCPKKGYSNLAVGSHTFQVRATDAAGNPDPSPASFTWMITA